MKFRPAKLIFGLPLGMAAALLASSHVQADSYYWDSNGAGTAGFGTVTGAWNTGQFWNTDATGGAAGTTTPSPLSTDDLLITAGTAGTITVTGTKNAGSLTVSDNAAITITGGALSLGGGTSANGLFVTSADTAAFTVASPVTLAGSTSISQAGAGTLSVTGAVTGGGNTLTLTGSGNGLLTITTGGLSFSGAGGLVIGKSGTLGTTLGGTITLGGTGGITVNSGSSAVTLGAATISAAQTWANNSSAMMTVSGNHTINSQLSLTAGAFTISGTNLGTGGVIINGATVSASNNAAFGALGSALTLTSGKLASNSGTGRVFSNNPLSINGSIILGDATNNGQLTFSNATQSVTGSNTITMGSAVSFTTGTMSLASGSNTTFSSASAGNLIMSGGFNTNGGTDTLTLNTAANTVTLSGAFTGTDGTLVLAGSGTNVTVNALTSTGNAVQVNSTTGGIYTLNGANTFTGGVTLTSGTLKLGNNAALGGAAGALTIAGGTIDVTNVRTTTNNNPQNWNGDFTFTGTNTWDTGTGAVTLGGNRLVTVSASTMTVGGATGDGGGGYGLTKLGAGTLVLSGSNTYTGATTISAGTLSVAATDNLGAPASNLVLDGGILQVTGTTLTTVTGSGHTVITNTDKPVGLDINNSGNTFTFDQVLNQGTGGLTKLGAGTLVLNQTNTYTGATSINQGSVSVATVGNTGANSNLGTNGTINIGATTVAGTLVHTGTGETSDKVINLAGTTGTAGINQSGATGNLLFTSNLIATGSGAKNLSLSGSTLGTGEISGNIVDSGGGATGVFKSGTGTWTLSGANTYSGLTDLQGAGGNLIMSGSNSSAGAIRVQSGTLTLNNASNGGIASGVLTLGSGGGLQATTAAPATLSNAVTLSAGSGGFSIAGSQSIVFNGDVTYVGNSDKGFNNTMTNGSTVTLNGFLNLSTLSGTNVFNTGNGSTGAPGTIIVNGVVRTLTVPTPGSVANTRGVLILNNNANSYAGTTNANGGVLAGTVPHAFGDSTSINITGSSAVLSLRGDATTNFTQLTGSAPYTITISVSGGTINVDQATIAGTGLKTMGIGAVTLNTANANTTNFTGANNTSLSVGAVSTGTGVSGTETINNSISGGGSLTLASIASNRTTGTPQTLAFTGNGNTTVTGAISQPGGAVINLTKSGTGTLTLSGTNTYTGTTTVNAGSTLVVSGSLVAGSGLVNVVNTATLGGNGNIGGSVTIASGGHHALAVGATPGTQITRTITGTLTLTSGSILDLTPAPTTGGGTYILVNASSITGTLGSPDLSAFPPGTTISIVGGNSLRLVVPGSDYDDWVASIPGTFTPTGPTDDADNDGLTNQEEYAFGLVPNSGSSVNPMTALLDKTTGQFTYTRRKPSLTGLVYAYEYSTTLGGWTALTPAATSSNSGDPVEAITVTVPAGLLSNPKLFVRVTAQ